jgi:hypothetical protein
MRCRSALHVLPAAAAAIAATGAAPAAPPTGAAPARPGHAKPVILGAGPVVDPSDVGGGGFRRVTFSPDGDGRADRVTIRVRARKGDMLNLWLDPISRSAAYLPKGVAAGGVTTIHWDGLRADGTRYPDGSYVLAVCDRVAHLCSQQRVLVHLRLISMYVPRATAVSPGETIRVHIATDRVGPYALDLVSAADPSGSGTGSIAVPAPGWTEYSVPNVPAGGLWLLRVRSGDAITHFPLVVHQPTIQLAAPPPHTALVVYPYLTWRAYDMFDGNRDGVVDSWYSHPRQPVVPLYGPFEPPADEPELEGREPNPESQSAFAAWMHSHTLTAEHVTDVELGRLSPAVLQRYASIVFEGHTEYYERKTYAMLAAYREAGGHLYFLQGNSFYGAAQVVGTSVWRRSYRYRTPARSDFAIAATGFRSCCWPNTIRPEYRLAAGVVEQLPWLFAGTALKDGDAFGLALGEVDTVDPTLSPPGTVTIATATVPAFTPTSEKRAFAWIGSRRIPYEPAWLKPRSIAIAYAQVGNGEVFSWGNTGFMRTVQSQDYGLPDAERAALDRAALNVWNRFTG